jgi:hypothetical protein
MNKMLRKMVKIFESVGQSPSERRDHEQFSGFQRGCDNSSTEFSQVVFVGSSDLFDKAMCSKPFEHARDLTGRFSDHMFFESLAGEAADVEFATANRMKQIEVVSVKEIKASIAAAIISDGPGDLFDVFLGRTGIVNGGDEIDIASVCGTHQFSKHIQAVDAFLQRRKLNFAGAVAMFHPAVVFEEGNVIDRCFDTQHEAVLIVHLYCHRPHVMFNACSLHAGVEVIAHLILIITVQFSSQKGGDIVGLDGMYGRSDQFIVDGSKIVLTLENNVGGVFDLHNAPMIAILELPDGRTVTASVGIEYSVNASDIDDVGQLLRFLKVFDAHKTVVEHSRIDAFAGQLSRQLVVAVEIELETKRRPRRHSEITQAKLGINEIEVVMQAFAAVVFEECFVCCLVMPGLIARTGLHGREYMHKAGMRTALNDDVLYTLLLAKVLLADEVDGKAILCGNGFGILPYLFSQRQCPLGIVENTDAVECQKPRHSLSIAYARNRAGQNNTVKTGNNALDFITMSLNEIWHARSFQHTYVLQVSKKCRAA